MKIRRFFLFFISTAILVLIWPLMFASFGLAALLKLLPLQSALGKLGFTSNLPIKEIKNSTKVLSNKKLTQAVWIHVASFGEWNTLCVFIDELKILQKKNRNFPQRIIVSTVNDDLAKHAENKGLPGVDELFYFPIENSLALRAIIKKKQVACIIIAELELWPFSLLALSSMGVPLFMVNAGLFRRETDIYKVFGWLFRPTLRQFTQIYPATQRSLQNFLSLGVADSVLAKPGSFKVDVALRNKSAARSRLKNNNLAPAAYQTGKNFLLALRQKITKAEPINNKKLLAKKISKKISVTKETELRPLVLFASMHVQEFSTLKSFFTAAKKDIFLPNQQEVTPLVIIAPRYFNGKAAHRWDNFLAKLQNMGFVVAKRSEPEGLADNTDVVLLDSFGEMATFFPLAKVVVLGGAFATIGGHNLLEPLAAGKKVITGAHLHHFLDVVENFASYIEVLFGSKRSCGQQLSTLVSKQLRKNYFLASNGKNNEGNNKIAGRKTNDEINKKLLSMQGASKKVAESIVSYY